MVCPTDFGRLGSSNDQDRTLPLAMSGEMFKVVTELVDCGHELLPKGIFKRDPCRIAVGSLDQWMEKIPYGHKCHINWILASWYLKAAYAHRRWIESHHIGHLDRTFAAGGLKLLRAPSEENAVSPVSFLLFPGRLTRSPVLAVRTAPRKQRKTTGGTTYEPVDRKMGHEDHGDVHSRGPVRSHLSCASS